MSTTGHFLKPIFIAGTSYPVGAATIDDALVSQLPRDTFVPTTEPNPNVDNRTPAQLDAVVLAAAAAEATAKVAAHNASASAHGFGVYTVAQLNAFTNANRPTGCVYCSDCLVPDGVGSPVVWDGAKWISTCSGFVATTDVLTFFRSCRVCGRSFDSLSTYLDSITEAPVVGGGASSALLTDGSGLIWSTGTSGSTGLARDASLRKAALSGANGRNATAQYFANTVWFSDLSSAAQEYNVQVGLASQAGGIIVADTAEFVLDRGNQLGLGNTGNIGNWLVVVRSSGAATTWVDSGIAAQTSLANSQLLEVLRTSSGFRFFINETEIPIAQTNIPGLAIGLVANNSLQKSNGALARTLSQLGRIMGVRF